MEHPLDGALQQVDVERLFLASAKIEVSSFLKDVWDICQQEQRDAAENASPGPGPEVTQDTTQNGAKEAESKCAVEVKEKGGSNFVDLVGARKNL